MSWAVGLDLGKVGDPTAMAAIQLAGEQLDLRHLERLRLGTPYPKIVQQTAGLIGAIPGAAKLVVDATGLGRPVVDMLRQAGLDPVPVVITAGRKTKRERDGVWKVPKRELVRCLVSAVEGNRLRVAKSLRLAGALFSELRAFRSLISRSGHQSFGGVGEHDDLALATALGVWALSVPFFRAQRQNERAAVHATQIPAMTAPRKNMEVFKEKTGRTGFQTASPALPR